MSSPFKASQLSSVVKTLHILYIHFNPSLPFRHGAITYPFLYLRLLRLDSAGVLIGILGWSTIVRWFGFCSIVSKGHCNTHFALNTNFLYFIYIVALEAQIVA